MPRKVRFRCPGWNLNRAPRMRGSEQCSRCSDWLRTGWSGDRIPLEARFSAPVQTGPWAHPASCTVGTGSFPGVKWQGRGVDHPPPSSAEVKERAELYFDSLFGPSWPVIWWTLTLTPRIQVRSVTDWSSLRATLRRSRCWWRLRVKNVRNGKQEGGERHSYLWGGGGRAALC